MWLSRRSNTYGGAYEIERNGSVKDGDVPENSRTFICTDEFPIELTVYAPSLLGHRFRSSITGKPIERATVAELEKLLARARADLSAGTRLDQLDEIDTAPDRCATSFWHCCCRWKTSSRIRGITPKGMLCFTACRCSACQGDDAVR